MAGCDYHINWQSRYLDWSSAPSGKKAWHIRRVAMDTGLTESSVYRRFQKMAGAAKACGREVDVYTEELVWDIAVRMETYKLSTLKDSNRALKTKHVIRRMEEDGVVEPGTLTVSGVNRALRSTGYRDAKPRVEYQASRYMELVQMDFSRSKHFQPKRLLESGDWLMEVNGKHLDVKMAPGTMRSWITSIVDDHSRLVYFFYDIDTGEKPELGLRALHHYGNRPEDGLPMRHAPEAIRADQGPFAKSQETQRLFEACGIRWQASEPENKQAQGKVEKRFDLLTRDFEAPLSDRLMAEQGTRRPTILLSRLQDLVLDYMLQMAGQQHPNLRNESGHRVTCMEAAQRSMLRTRPRLFDIDVMAIASRSWPRTVSTTCRVSITRTMMRGDAPVELVAPGRVAGKEIVVEMNGYGQFLGYLADDVHRNRFELTPYEGPLPLGEFASHRQTYAERAHEAAKARLQGRALGATPLVPDATSIEPESPFVGVTQPDQESSNQSILTLAEARGRLGRSLVEDGFCSYEDLPEYLDAAEAHGLLRAGMTADEADDLFIQMITATRRTA